MKKAKIRCINSKKLTDFISSFKVMDSNVLLELNGVDNITIKSFISSKTAIKYGKLNMSAVFDLENSQIDSEDKILVGIYNIKNFISMLSNVDEGQFDILLEYDEKNECYTDKMMIKSESLKLNIPNAEKIMFTRMKDEILDDIFNTEKSVFNFKMDDTIINKVLTLIGYETSKVIKLKLKKTKDDNVLLFSGKNFDVKYNSTVELTKDSLEIPINKDYFNYLDKCKYDVYGYEEQVYFFNDSEDIEMKVVLGAYLDTN